MNSAFPSENANSERCLTMQMQHKFFQCSYDDQNDKHLYQRAFFLLTSFSRAEAGYQTQLWALTYHEHILDKNLGMSPQLDMMQPKRTHGDLIRLTINDRGLVSSAVLHKKEAILE